MIDKVDGMLADITIIEGRLKICNREVNRVMIELKKKVQKINDLKMELSNHIQYRQVMRTVLNTKRYNLSINKVEK